jgi:hypothetical protein
MSAKATKDIILHRAWYLLYPQGVGVPVFLVQFIVMARANFISRKEREDDQEGGAAT